MGRHVGYVVEAGFRRAIFAAVLPKVKILTFYSLILARLATMHTTSPSLPLLFHDLNYLPLSSSSINLNQNPQ